MSKIKKSGLMAAMLDAIHGSDEKIAGQAITRLSAPLNSGDASISVVSTIGFGEYTDGTGDGRVVIGGEIIDTGTRTFTSFGALTRGVSSTKIPAVHPVGTIVYDYAQNTSGYDLARRGFLVNFAIGRDLDVVGRNLGMHRCPGLLDDTYRAVIKAVAYLAKQTPVAVVTAMDALEGPGNYTFLERLVSSPSRFFIFTGSPAPATSLQGRFMLNGGEPHIIEAGGVINLDYDINVPAIEAAAATGSIRVVSGAFLVDGETFTLDDGVNPPVVFEFDNNGSVVESPVLRQVVFAATDSEETVRDTIIAAVTGAPALNMTAGVIDAQRLSLTNTVTGVAGNQAILETVADAVFEVDGMAGGVDAGVDGAIKVTEDIVASRQGGWREPDDWYAQYGGTISGPAQITLTTVPGALIGASVLVDYGAFFAHYLPPDEAFRNDGTDYPPYFSDSTLAADCLLDQVRAAGVGVEASVNP